MKFWKRLRWLATALFLVMVVAVWWYAEPGLSSAAPVDATARAAPAF